MGSESTVSAEGCFRCNATKQRWTPHQPRERRATGISSGQNAGAREQQGNKHVGVGILKCRESGAWGKIQEREGSTRSCFCFYLRSSSMAKSRSRKKKQPGKNGGEHTDPGFSRWVLPARGLLKVFLKVSQI